MPHTSSHELVIRQHVSALVRELPGARAGDVNAIHQARVATRKLRSNLRTFAPLLDVEWTEPLRAELGWLAMGLGAVRDREVLLQRLRDRTGTLPANDQRSAESLLLLLAMSIALVHVFK